MRRRHYRRRGHSADREGAVIAIIVLILLAMLTTATIGQSGTVILVIIGISLVAGTAYSINRKKGRL